MAGNLGDPLTFLAAVAARTDTLRVGTGIFQLPVHNPVRVAEQVATIDELSGGRISLGVGTGWWPLEYEVQGSSFRDRGARMDEALRILKLVWTEEDTAFEGRFWSFPQLTVYPRPVQRPHPPVMVGGGGPRMLRIAAREAQIVALAPAVNERGGPKLRTVTLRSLEERIARLRTVAADRFAELELNVIVFDAQVTDARQSLLAALAARVKASATALLKTPFFLYGSRASLVEELLERRERCGVSYIALPGEAMRAFAPIVADLRGR